MFERPFRPGVHYLPQAFGLDLVDAELITAFLADLKRNFFRFHVSAIVDEVQFFLKPLRRIGDFIRTVILLNRGSPFVARIESCSVDWPGKDRGFNEIRNGSFTEIACLSGVPAPLSVAS